jgi:ADP-ribosylglycohydrolase
LIAAILNGLTDVEKWSETLVKMLKLDSEVNEAILVRPFQPRNRIQSSGYVVHSLGASLWSFYNSSNYRDCVLAAANLGGDSDTTGAIAGMLAGAYYGLSGIPAEWVDKLTMRIEIELMAEELYRLALERGEAARERAGA